jgi:hypothetical protein
VIRQSLFLVVLCRTTRKSLAGHVSLSSYLHVKERASFDADAERDKISCPDLRRATDAHEGKRSGRAGPAEAAASRSGLYAGCVSGVNDQFSGFFHRHPEQRTTTDHEAAAAGRETRCFALPQPFLGCSSLDDGLRLISQATRSKVAPLRRGRDAHSMSRLSAR